MSGRLSLHISLNSLSAKRYFFERKYQLFVWEIFNPVDFISESSDLIMKDQKKLSSFLILESGLFSWLEIVFTLQHLSLLIKNDKNVDAIVVLYSHVFMTQIKDNLTVRLWKNSTKLRDLRKIKTIMMNIMLHNIFAYFKYKLASVTIPQRLWRFQRMKELRMRFKFKNHIHIHIFIFRSLIHVKLKSEWSFNFKHCVVKRLLLEPETSSINWKLSNLHTWRLGEPDSIPVDAYAVIRNNTEI